MSGLERHALILSTPVSFDKLPADVHLMLVLLMLGGCVAVKMEMMQMRMLMLMLMDSADDDEDDSLGTCCSEVLHHHNLPSAQHRVYAQLVHSTKHLQIKQPITPILDLLISLSQVEIPARWPSP